MAWLSGYSKRKKLTLTGGASGAQTDFQLSIAVSYAAAMQGDFDDIRFTQVDGTTLVDAWAEVIVTDTSAEVWVEFPTTPANTVEQDYYMYYGNGSVAPDWDGAATFELFDDFSSDHFADNGLFVPFTRISPAGIYCNNKTFITWHGKPNNLDPYVIEYNHLTGEWSSAVKAGDNPLGDDNHGAPCIIRDSSGYLHVFFGTHNSAIEHVKSTNIDDISAWTVKTDVGGNATYQQAVVVGSDIYLMYRKTVTSAGGRGLVCIKSTDGGEAWGSENTMVDVSSSFWLYPGGGIVAEGTSKIHFAWYRNNRDVATTQYENIYHAYLNLSDLHLYAMDGTDLGTTISEAEMADCLVFQDETVGAYRCLNPKCHLDSSGYPYIIFYHVGNIKFTRWTGSAWTTPETITAGSGTAGEFIVHSATDIEAYLTDSSYNIDKWTWDGTTWTFIEQIYTKGTMVATTSSKVILNGDSDLKIVFGEQNEDYTTSLKTYAYGDSGFVQSTPSCLDTDIWDVISGSPTVENGQLHLDDGERIDTKTWTGNTVALRLKATVPNETGSAVYALFGLSENTLDPFVEFITYSDWDVRSRNGSGNEITTISAYNGEHTFEILKNAGTEAKFYVDDVLKDTDTTYVPDVAMPIRLGKTGSNDLLIDWVFAHKHVTGPPTYVFGSEESAPTEYDVYCTLALYGGITDAGQANMGASLTLAQIATVADAGQADTGAAATLTDFLGVSESAFLETLAALTLSQTAAITTSAQATAEASLSLGQGVTISTGATAVTGAALSLTNILTITQGVGQDIDVDLTLAQSLGITDAAQAAAQASTLLSKIVAVSQSAAANTAASLSLAYQAALTTASGGTVEAALSIAIHQGISATVTLDYGASLALAQSLGVAESAHATTEAGLTLNQNLALVLLAQAVAGAGLSLNAIQRITATATTIIAELITPDGRTVIITFENRTTAIPAENRMVIIPSAN